MVFRLSFFVLILEARESIFLEVSDQGRFFWFYVFAPFLLVICVVRGWVLDFVWGLGLPCHEMSARGVRFVVSYGALNK